MSEAKSMSAAVAAPAKSVKNASKPSPSAAATGSKHPSYATMIIKALADLAERKGSSRQAIVKYILGTYDLSGSRTEKFVSGALKAQMEGGSVINASGTGLSGRFKLSPAMKTQLAKAEKARAKKVESKEESGNAKKSAPKKPAVANPKKPGDKPRKSADKPKQSVKMPSAKSAKPKSALKSPKKKSEGKSKAASKSKVMKKSPAMNGKKASKTADALKSPKPKKSAPPKSGKKAQIVSKKGPKK